MVIHIQGDSTIYTFEVTEENPYVCPLSHHRCGSLHQGLSFLSKKDCDVASVEFAKALRLSNNTIEPLSFTVPRIKVCSFEDRARVSTQLIEFFNFRANYSKMIYFLQRRWLGSRLWLAQNGSPGRTNRQGGSASSRITWSLVSDKIVFHWLFS